MRRFKFVAGAVFVVGSGFVVACGEAASPGGDTLPIGASGAAMTSSGGTGTPQSNLGSSGSSPVGAGGTAVAGASGAPLSSGGGMMPTVMGGMGPMAMAGSAGMGASTSGGGAGGSAGAVAMTSGAGGVGAGGMDMAGSGGDGVGGESNVPDVLSFAAGFHELFIHDECTGVEPTQPDTCLHDQLHEEEFVFGGEAPAVYDVTLRVRGLFEPTTIDGGEAPLAEHPYFRVGGTVAAVDWSRWHIVVSDPEQTYWLNHYPSTSHTIYAQDFEITIPVAAGADVAVRVVDGNSRQIDNAEEGLADRRQLIDGVTDEVLDGQVLRLDVVDVTPQ